MKRRTVRKMKYINFYLFFLIYQLFWILWLMIQLDRPRRSSLSRCVCLCFLCLSSLSHRLDKSSLLSMWLCCKEFEEESLNHIIRYFGGLKILKTKDDNVDYLKNSKFYTFRNFKRRTVDEIGIIRLEDQWYIFYV